MLINESADELDTVLQNKRGMSAMHPIAAVGMVES